LRRCLNSKKNPELFVLGGAAQWAGAKIFPCSMPGIAAYESDGGIYAKYILQPNAKIASRRADPHLTGTLS
jgi:branched-chain amino acid transport system substrate-binding protein